VIETGSQNINSFHLAGIVPVAGQPLDFNMPWHDCLMPIAADYLAVEHAVLECATAGCETIWVVCHTDMQPLIRHRVGEWILDPASMSRGPTPSTELKRVPIYYVPIHPKDRDRRDCLGWSALYGSLTAYHISKRLSKWVIPDRYYVSFPYGVYPLDTIREARHKISASAPFCLRSGDNNIKTGEYLGFTFDGEDFKKCRSFVRNEATARWDRAGNSLPIEKRYSARHFSLDKIFSCVILDKSDGVQVPWYYSIDSWAGYKDFLSSDHGLEKPEFMRSKTWNTIGSNDDS
jgi:hypothetical protein